MEYKNLNMILNIYWFCSLLVFTWCKAVLGRNVNKTRHYETKNKGFETETETRRCMDYLADVNLLTICEAVYYVFLSCISYTQPVITVHCK